jgi:antitoxin (DNA-binding transcriptional repressor) of toxin-antitoxin stability system
MRRPERNATEGWELGTYVDVLDAARRSNRCRWAVALSGWPFVKRLCYNTHMSTPISALQRNASLVVRRVAASGVAEEITDRGRVVAILAPPPRTEGLERLRQAGAVRPAKPGQLYEVIKELGTLPEIGLMDALQEQRDTDR